MVHVQCFWTIQLQSSQTWADWTATGVVFEVGLVAEDWWTQFWSAQQSAIVADTEGALVQLDRVALLQQVPVRADAARRRHRRLVRFWVKTK